MAEFQDFMDKCDQCLDAHLGISHSDLADATWFDYYADEMRPDEACAHALHDWNDMEFDELEEIGLGGWV